MIEVDRKKDPGKFTVRFNLCDPQQRQAAELLNQQGRSKAQFIANAVLHYSGGERAAEPQEAAVDNDQLRQLIEDILAQRTGPPEQVPRDQPPVPNRADSGALNDIERQSILQTLDAFQQQ